MSKKLSDNMNILKETVESYISKNIPAVASMPHFLTFYMDDEDVVCSLSLSQEIQGMGHLRNELKMGCVSAIATILNIDPRHVEFKVG